MSLFKPKNSAYWYLDLADGRGGRIKRSTGRKIEAEAQAIHDVEEKRISDLIRLGDGGAHTFAEAAERWLRETEKKTVDKDRYQLQWLTEQLGAETRLSSIHIGTVNRLRELCAEDDDGKPRSKATVNLYMACLRSVLRKAQSEWGWLTAVPKVPMYGKGKKAKKKAKYYLTPEEFERLRAELPEHLGLAAEFAVETGLRMRSMLGLTWDRVDLKAKHAWVPSDAHDGNGGQKGGNNFGFTLSPGAIDVLKRCKALFPTGNHVFQYPDSTLSTMTDADIERACRDLKKAGPVTCRRLRAELQARFGVRGNTERVTEIWRRVCKPSTSRAGIVWNHADAALRLEVIRAYCDSPSVKGDRRFKGSITLHDAARRLSMARRQVQRLAAAYRAHGPAAISRQDATAPPPLAASGAQDRPYDDANTAAFKKAVVRAGLDPKLVHWHTFRHTFASWAVQSGVTLLELMVLGDWADMDSVLVYAHLAPGNMARAASKVSQFRLRGRAA